MEDAGRVAEHPLRVFLIAFAFVAALSVLWSLATPIFASPDESAHATKAVAQVRGQLIGDPPRDDEGSGFPTVALPDDYRFHPQVLCFAFQPEVPANCGVELGAEYGSDFFGNWVTKYNPVYYWVVGWPSLLLGGSAGVYAMRVVSALLNAAILALAFVIAVGGARRWAPFALAFAASPMVVFLAGSVNPQGVEISAGVLTWVAMLRLFERYRDGTRGIAGDRWLEVGVLVGSAALLNARALGPIWWLLIVVVAVAAAGWRSVPNFFTDRTAWPLIGMVAIAGIASVGWTLYAGTLGGQAEEGDAALVDGSVFAGMWAMLRQTPAFVEQSIGVFGWLDTVVPGIAVALYLGAALLLVAIAIATAGGRGGRVLGLAVAVAVAAPAIVQGVAVARTGLIWQGRYSLLLYLGVLIVAAVVLDRWGDRRANFLSVRLTVIGAVLLGIFHVVAFAFALFRYTVGTAGTVDQMITSPAWQPPLGWSLLVLLLAVVISAFSIWVSVLARSAAVRDDVRTGSAV